MFVDNTLGILSIPISRYLEDPAVSVVTPNRQERELIGYDRTFDNNPNWNLTNRFAYNNIDYRQRLNGADSFDQFTGVMMRNTWDAYLDAQTISTNLDLKGRFLTGSFNHAVLIGTDPDRRPDQIFFPAYSSSGYVPNPDNFFPLRETWKGVYAQDMIYFADDRLHLLIGGRYDWADIGNGFSPNSNAEATGPFHPATGVGSQSLLTKPSARASARWSNRSPGCHR
jgi:iron complex outermembrane receptor protein